MANDDLLHKLAKNNNFKKADHSLKQTAPKKGKVRYNKTVQITADLYKQLKLYSFKNDIPMAKIATDSITSYLNEHKV